MTDAVPSFAPDSAKAAATPSAPLSDVASGTIVAGIAHNLRRAFVVPLTEPMPTKLAALLRQLA